MATINPLPYVQAIIHSGFDKFRLFKEAEIINSLVLLKDGKRMSEAEVDPELVSAESQKNHDPAMREIRVVPLTRAFDSYPDLLINAYKVMPLKSIYDLKGDYIGDLGSVYSEVKRAGGDPPAEFMKSVMRAFAEELGHDPSGIESAREQFEAGVFDIWDNGKDPEKAFSQLADLYAENLGREDIAYSPGISDFIFREEGFMRKAQTFIAGNCLWLIKQGKPVDKRLVWSNWTYNVDYPRQTIDANLQSAVAEIKNNPAKRDMDKLDRIAFCILMSGFGVETIADISVNLNKGKDWWNSIRNDLSKSLIEKFIHANSQSKGYRFSQSAYQAIMHLVSESAVQRPVTIPSRPATEDPPKVAAPVAKKKETGGGGMNGIVVGLGALIAWFLFQGGI